MPSHPTFLLTLLLFPPLTLNTILSLRDGFSPDNEILRNDNWCITGQSDVGNGFSARLGGMAGLFIAIVKVRGEEWGVFTCGEIIIFLTEGDGADYGLYVRGC